MALVLVVGTIDALMESRRLLIEAAGHEAIPVTNDAELISACKKNLVDVAVFGQMMAPAEKIRGFDLFRQHCPNAKVLSLYSPSVGPVLRSADDWLAVPADVPSELAERISELVR